MVHSTKTFRHRTKTRLIKAYKALYYGCFGCAPALRWKRYLPGTLNTQVIFAKSNGNCLAYHDIPKNGSTTVKSLLLDAIGHPVPASVEDVHTAFHSLGYQHWRKCAPSDIYYQVRTQISNCPSPPRIPPGFDHAFHFAFVRNPWARLASCYAGKVLAKLPHRYWNFINRYPGVRFERMTFTDFVRFVCRVPDDLCEQHFASQCCLLDGSPLDFVGRVERFSDDLGEIIRLAGLDERLLKWAHVKRHRGSTAARNLDKRAHMKTMLSTLQDRPRSDSPHHTDFYTTKTRNLVARKYAKDIDRFGYRFGD